MDTSVLFTYKKDGMDTITVNFNDYKGLAPRKCLNDHIITFYLRYVWLEILPIEYMKSTIVLSTFFYENIRNNGVASVQNWNKNINIFEKDYIVLPINVSEHWYLAIICFPRLCEADRNDPEVSGRSNSASRSRDLRRRESTSKNEERKENQPLRNSEDGLDSTLRPCILVFNSINYKAENHYQNLLLRMRDFLKMEFKKRRGNSRKIFLGDRLELRVVDVPLQDDTSNDCGLYLLQYFESFFDEKHLEYITPPYPSLQDWFTRDRIDQKRREIQELLTSLTSDETCVRLLQNYDAEVRQKLRVQEEKERLLKAKAQTILESQETVLNSSELQETANESVISNKDTEMCDAESFLLYDLQEPDRGISFMHSNSSLVVPINLQPPEQDPTVFPDWVSSLLNCSQASSSHTDSNDTVNETVTTSVVEVPSSNSNTEIPNVQKMVIEEVKSDIVVNFDSEQSVVPQELKNFFPGGLKVPSNVFKNLRVHCATGKTYMFQHGEK